MRAHDRFYSRRRRGRAVLERETVRHSSQVVVGWKESEGMRRAACHSCLLVFKIRVAPRIDPPRHCLSVTIRVTHVAACFRSSCSCAYDETENTEISRRHSSLVNHHDYAIFAWRNPRGGGKEAALCPDDRIDRLRSRPIAKFEIFFLTLRNATFLKFVLTLHHMGIWVEDRYERTNERTLSRFGASGRIESRDKCHLLVLRS